MKRFLTTCFYLILTSATITAVFFLPSILFSYEDQQMFAKVEHTEIEPMEFSYSYSLFDTINLLSSGYYTVEYPSSGGTRTADEICKITADAFEQLNDCGKKNGIAFIDPENKIMRRDASLQLAISDNYENQLPASDSLADTDIFDSSKDQKESVAASDSQSTDITSAAVWICHLYSEYGYLAEFRIDDKSGKIVGMFLWNNPKKPQTTVWSADKLLKTFRKFLKNYYGLETEITLPDETKSAVKDASSPIYSTDNSYSMTVTETERTTFVVRLTDEFGKPARMLIKISPEFISLN